MINPNIKYTPGCENCKHLDVVWDDTKEAFNERLYCNILSSNQCLSGCICDFFENDGDVGLEVPLEEIKDLSDVDPCLLAKVRIRGLDKEEK